jgi:hypothetical protein
MLNTEKFVLTLLAAILLCHLSGCSSTCDCSTFPPKSGCDAQCGITTGIVESVTANSVVIQVPSIKQGPAGEKSTMISRRTFSIGGAEATQLQSIPKGSRVALTFRQEGGQTVVQSIRKIPAEPAS